MTHVVFFTNTETLEAKVKPEGTGHMELKTATYVKNLREAGVEAHMDVFHGNIHGFDMMTWTKNAKAAKQKLFAAVEKYMG